MQVTIHQPVHEPIFRAVTDALYGGASFSPTGTKFWYDPSDLSTLFQDAAGTVPVTAIGQTVKRWNDKSGNGYHVSNASSAWKLQHDGINYFVETDNATKLSSSSFAWGTGQVSIFAAIKSNQSGNKDFLNFGNISSITGSFKIEYYSGGSLIYYKGSGSFGARGSASYGLVGKTTGLNVNLAGSTYATECTDLRIDGVQGALTNFGATDSGSGNFSTNALEVGGGTNFFNGRIYQLYAFDTVSDATKLAENEAYCMSKCIDYSGGTYYSPTTFLDTGANINRTSYYETSPFSRAKYTTTATILTVNAYTNIYSYFPESSEIALYVDGVFHSTLSAYRNLAYSVNVSLPAGTKTIEFVSGLQSSPGETFASIFGTWFVGVYGNAALTPVSDTPTNRIVFYGDSITSGSTADPTVSLGYPALVRAAYGADSVAVEAFGFRSLYMDAVDSTARSAFVAKIVSYAPSIIWMAIGTNDYGISKWSAANFGAAYAAVLDDLHTALPSAVIYCQTPLLRTSEGGNTFGDTLGNYRTQIATAQSTRSSYATLVDGTAIMTTASLIDAVHPGTAGHELFADAIIAELGI